MTRYQGSIGVAFFLSAWIHAGPATAVPQYRAEQIGNASTFARGLNNLGQVVGAGKFDDSGNDTPFVYSQGQLQVLPEFVGADANAYSINDRGDIAGIYWNGNAFLLRDGQMINPTASLGARSYGIGLNQLGHATGTASPGVSAYFYDGSSARYILKDPPAPYASNGVDINDRDEIVGSITFSSTQNDRAYLYAEGRYTLLPTLGGDFNIAYGINNAGQIVGSSTTQDGQQLPFLYSQGKLENLGTLGGDTGMAYDINNRGAIVGETFDNAIPLSGTGFLYQDGQMYDLNSLLSGAAWQRWDIRDAGDINDRGQILVTATQRDVPNSRRYSVLLTPVPEPQMAVLLAAGLGVLGVAARRRRKEHGVIR